MVRAFRGLGKIDREIARHSLKWKIGRDIDLGIDL